MTSAMKKSLIYSVITNKYDSIKPVRNYKGFDFWLFTDQEDLCSKGWEIKPLWNLKNSQFLFSLLQKS